MDLTGTASPRTVFVLGAGSSAPFGLPCGESLKNTLIKRAPELTQALERSVGRDSDRWQSRARDLGEMFADALRSSGAPTIDAFLRHRTDQAELGRALIAKILLIHEGSAIKDATNNWNWIARIFHDTYGRNPNPTTPPFGIVSFNYDRIARFALALMTKDTFNLQLSASQQIISAIPFHHVYGHLGIETISRYRREEYDRVHGFGDNCSIAGKSIRIMYDDRAEDAKHLRPIKELVQNAEILVFLGFGFDKDNLKMIGIDIDSGTLELNAKSILSTNVGLGERLCERLTSDLAFLKYFSFGQERDCLSVVSDLLEPADYF